MSQVALISAVSHMKWARSSILKRWHTASKGPGWGNIKFRQTKRPRAIAAFWDSWRRSSLASGNNSVFEFEDGAVFSSALNIFVAGDEMRRAVKSLQELLFELMTRDSSSCLPDYLNHPTIHSRVRKRISQTSVHMSPFFPILNYIPKYSLCQVQKLYFKSFRAALLRSV